MSKRGFTLVELAIAMVVLGLLVSVALGPMRERLRNADIRETNETLVAASEAVVAYAIRHNTSGRLVLQGFNNGSPTIPVGRPYLPCPDTDGDGVEDRKVIPIGETMIPAAEIGEEEKGGCERNKGLLPWRTIGGPQSDKWGTHLTYRVDPNFSHGALGFDQRTRAESMDTLMAIPGGGAWWLWGQISEARGRGRPVGGLPDARLHGGRGRQNRPGLHAAHGRRGPGDFPRRPENRTRGHPGGTGGEPDAKFLSAPNSWTRPPS